MEVLCFATRSRIAAFQGTLLPPRCMQKGPLKRWYPTTALDGVTTHKTATWIFAMKNLKSRCSEAVYSSFQTYKQSSYVVIFVIF